MTRLRGGSVQGFVPRLCGPRVPRIFRPKQLKLYIIFKSSISLLICFHTYQTPVRRIYFSNLELYTLILTALITASNLPTKCHPIPPMEQCPLPFLPISWHISDNSTHSLRQRSNLCKPERTMSDFLITEESMRGLIGTTKVYLETTGRIYSAKRGSWLMRRDFIDFVCRRSMEGRMEEIYGWRSLGCILRRRGWGCLMIYRMSIVWWGISRMF